MAITPGLQRALAPKAVSSSSIDTTLSAHIDGGNDFNNAQPILALEDSTMIGAENTYIAQNMYYTPRSTTVPTEPANSSLMLPRQTHMYISPSTGVTVPSAVSSTNTVPEFLYQLTKMLTDNNRDIIEWSNGKIEVHNPHKLQTHVLNRYFRHSKFASFQRQLNYFGFRKLAGKGKMAPCSYVNDATTKELGSLLLIKRKAGNEPKAKGAKKREVEENMSSNVADGAKSNTSVNPVLANILYRSSGDRADSTRSNPQSNGAQPPNQSQQALAKVAVGKGIRHSFSVSRKPAPLPQPVAPVAASTPNLSPAPTPVEDCLTALKSNFKNSLQAQEGDEYGLSQAGSYTTDYIPGSLRRDDSLVDLAMIPLVDEGNLIDPFSTDGLTFIDFPWQDPAFPPSDG